MKHLSFTVIEGVINSPLDYTAGDTNLCKFSLKSMRTDKELSINIVTKNKLADTCNKYLKQNSRVLISGILKQGIKGMYLESKEINFLSPAK